MFDTLIDSTTLAGQIEKPDWAVVDCRFDLADHAAGERGYADAHIPGSVYAHMETVLSGPITPQTGRHPLPDPKDLCRWLGDHGIGRQTGSRRCAAPA